MSISPQVEAQYESNRLKMSKVNHDFRIYMWCGIALGALIFFTSFMAGAMSTAKGNAEGPSIFYNAMSAGVFQILLGLLTIVLSWLTAMKTRVPSLILLGVDAVGILLILLRRNGTFTGANLIFLIASIALNIWAQLLCNQNDELKTQPGYPIFSIQADTRAHYELPKDVLIRQQQASKHMSSIGGNPAPAQVPKQPEQPAQQPASASAFAPSPILFLDPAPVKLPPEIKLHSETEQSLGIADMTGTTHQFMPKPETLAAPTDVSLDSLAAQTPQGNEAALPQADPAAMLADMASIPSHATVKGNPDMLPSAEDVKARLAAMKRAREEHHPET